MQKVQHESTLLQAATNLMDCLPLFLFVVNSCEDATFTDDRRCRAIIPSPFLSVQHSLLTNPDADECMAPRCMDDYWEQNVMRDRHENSYELHESARTWLVGANVIGSSRNAINLVPAKTEVGAAEVAATIVVIDKRALVRKCFAQCLQAASKQTVVSFPNVDSWLKACHDTLASLVLLCIAGKPNDPETQQDISRLCQQANRLPTILLSDVEDPNQIADAIGRGVRGYIPTSMALEVVIAIMDLVRAGGEFVPASSLIAARQSNNCVTASQHSGAGLFTARQAAVVEALRRGKATKIIAYELNLRESTVKMHIGSIMKKLKARNRTEVAFMANEIMQSRSAV